GGLPNLEKLLYPLDLYRVQHHILVGLVLAATRNLGNLVDHLLSFDHFPKDRVITGEPWCRRYGDEELRTICVGAGIGHCQLACLVEFVRRALGLILELIAGAAHAGARGVSSLDHEVGNHAVKNGAVIQRRLALAARARVSPFARAFCKFDEVLNGDGSVLLEETTDDGSFAGVK